MRGLEPVPAMPVGAPGDRGLFGPESIVWRVARERAVLLGGPAALLLQVAHPLVAAGVADHSDFREQPLDRLTGTLRATLVTTFGDAAQARAAAAAVARRHARVTGTLAEDRASWPTGTPYRATQPDLALWVYATLIEVGLDAYSQFVSPLSPGERARYFRESAPFGRLFGVTDAVRPATYEEFRAYYRHMLDERLVVDEHARAIAAAVFGSRLYGLPVGPAATLVAWGLLPPRIGDAYGLSPGIPGGGAYLALKTASRVLLRLTPSVLRFWPHYGVGLRRIAAGGP